MTHGPVEHLAAFHRGIAISANGARIDPVTHADGVSHFWRDASGMGDIRVMQPKWGWVRRVAVLRASARLDHLNTNMRSTNRL